jgi:hypothetical protein
MAVCCRLRVKTRSQIVAELVCQGVMTAERGKWKCNKGAKNVLARAGSVPTDALAGCGCPSGHPSDADPSGTECVARSGEHARRAEPAGQATIGSTICIRGWTMTVRPSQQCTSALKRQQEEGTRENWTTEEIDKRLRESFGRRHQAVIQLLNLDTRLPIVPGMVLSHLLHRCPVQIAANACEARQVFGRYIPERPIGATAQKRDIALLLFWGGLTSTGSISVATVTPITVTRRIQLLPYYCP